MPNQETVIKGLERCLAAGCDDCNQPDKSGYPWDCEGFDRMVNEAVALLKAQEPRVMTLGEIRAFYHYREDHVWPFDTPPYLWVETNGRTVPYWMAWNSIIACLKGQFPKYDPDDYGKTWRCWTQRPTDEQREATPWQQD